MNLEFANGDVLNEAVVIIEDDELDTSDPPEYCEYEENSWPDNAEEPTGFSYKGKKRVFIKAVENVKILMKKGTHKLIDDKVTMRVMDSRNIPHGTEMDVEVTKDKERGFAILKTKFKERMHNHGE